MADYFIEENELTKKMFKLDEILSFQLKNDIQIIRGEDFQYICYINKLAYTTALTPMLALCCGIKCFKENLSDKEETEDDKGLIDLNNLLDKVGNISDKEYEELYNQAIDIPTTVLEHKEK